VFFGTYLHALVVHSPPQYEIVCLRSVNTENQERMFQQMKQTAVRTTNRHPGNVVSSILLHLQAKQLAGQLSQSLEHGESRVKKASVGVPPFSGTVVSRDFVRSRSSSWQAHLERISSFLVCGEGLWWQKTQDGFRFFDGDSDPSFRTQGPPLLHHRSTTLEQIQVARREIWKEIVSHETSLPAITVRLFDEDGNFCGMKHSDTQDASALSMLGSLHNQHHLDSSMDVPVTSGFNCPLTDIATPTKRPRVVPMVSTPSTSILDTSVEVPVTSATKDPVTGIATPAKHPWVVPEVSTSSTSILDCTPVLHSIQTPTNLPRLVPMMSTPSSGDLDHFTIHDLSVIDTSVEEGTQLPVTYQDAPEEEDGQVILRDDNEGSPSTLKTKLGQAVLRAVGESNELKQLDELHHRLKLKRKNLKQKPTSSEAHQHQCLLSAVQSAVLRKKIELSRMFL